MNLEARPWLVDFLAAAELDSFPFLRILRSGFFSLVVSGVLYALRSGFGVFLA